MPTTFKVNNICQSIGRDQNNLDEHTNTQFIINPSSHYVQLIKSRPDKKLGKYTNLSLSKGNNSNWLQERQ